MTISLKADASGTSGSIQLGGVDQIKFGQGGVEFMPATPFSLRNKIINGAFTVAQRGTSGAVANNYTLDRWIIFAAGTAQTWSQAAGGLILGKYFPNLLQITGASGNTATAVVQRIESINSADLTGQTATFSAYIKQATGGARDITIYTQAPSAKDNWTSSTVLATSPSISLPNDTWKRVTWTVALPASGPDRGLSFEMTLGALSAGQSIQIAGAQLEVGAVATPFEHRHFGVELAMCQRYYEYPIPTGLGTVASILTDGQIAGTFKVNKRAVPTISIYPGKSLSDCVIEVGTAFRTPASLILSATPLAFSVQTSGVSYAASFRPLQLMEGIIQADAEL